MIKNEKIFAVDSSDALIELIKDFAEQREK
jgi:hypothetical protein